MTRAVLALMAGLLCAAAGCKYGAQLKSEAVRLTRWEQLLEHLSLLLREAALPLPQLLYSASDTTQSPDQLLRSIAALIQQEPRISLESAYLRCKGFDREKAILQRMFSRMGHGSKENRILAVEQASREIALLARRANESADKDIKLWQTLGFIGGACLTILLI